MELAATDGNTSVSTSSSLFQPLQLNHVLLDIQTFSNPVASIKCFTAYSDVKTIQIHRAQYDLSNVATVMNDATSKFLPAEKRKGRFQAYALACTKKRDQAGRPLMNEL